YGQQICMGSNGLFAAQGCSYKERASPRKGQYRQTKKGPTMRVGPPLTAQSAVNVRQLPHA
ncbi:hypothetical protein, partial [Pseudomonas putida]|uniref:hypothetical protein n=1 Tax=Pseudomonas putida TaxID=303 RepID=UPI002363D478